MFEPNRCTNFINNFPLLLDLQLICSLNVSSNKMQAFVNILYTTSVLSFTYCKSKCTVSNVTMPHILNSLPLFLYSIKFHLHNISKRLIFEHNYRRQNEAVLSSYVQNPIWCDSLKPCDNQYCAGDCQRYILNMPKRRFGGYLYSHVLVQLSYLFVVELKIQSVAQIIVFGGWLVNWREYGRKWSWPALRYYPGRGLEGARNITQALDPSAGLRLHWLPFTLTSAVTPQPSSTPDHWAVLAV